MKHLLYGDGIHDDQPAIQEMIDSGVCEVVLPVPKKHYLISKPIELPSNFTLRLPRYATVRLADGANCVMVKNKMQKDPKKRLSEEVYTNPVWAHLWSYVDDYSPDAPCENIEIKGGIWDCNNQNQLPNPERNIDLSVREFYGCGMLFYNVKGFKLSELTVKDPSQYGVTMDKVSYFTVEDVTFDYNLGNPYPINMDGIHLDGNCHDGVIRNLKGTCYDDLVAINAHEGSRGPITNIEIDGLFAENCHSAVRLLSLKQVVRNIHISNVFGTYYQYCIGITKGYRGETEGYFDAITLENLCVSKAMPVRKGDFQHPPKLEQVCPLIFIQGDTVTKSLRLCGFLRKEKVLAKESFFIGAEATVDRLLIENVAVSNGTGEEMPFLVNHGRIGYLSMQAIDTGSDACLVNDGEIQTMHTEEKNL